MLLIERKFLRFKFAQCLGTNSQINPTSRHTEFTNFGHAKHLADYFLNDLRTNVVLANKL